MVLLEAVAVIGVVAILLYLLIATMTSRTATRTSATTSGRWRVNHYDTGGRTRVVVQKVATESGRVLDEHVIDTVRVDDPDYDERFLTAMATARQRLALFESEE
jgi:hypothetical protein